jgi:hypothetical protein
MLINLCHDQNPLAAYLHSRCYNEEIIDIAGVLDSRVFINTVNFSTEDDDLEKEAIRLYLDFAAGLSDAWFNGMAVRDFKVLNTSIFWFTPFSEKHNCFHWGKDFFTLVALLKRNRALFAQSNSLLLSAQFYYVKPLIENLFSDCNVPLESVVLIGNHEGNKTYLYGLLKGFKNYLTYNFLRKKVRKKFSSASDCANIFMTIFPGTWNNKTGKDLDLGELENLCRTQKYSYIPLLTDFGNHDFDWEKTDSYFLKSFPSSGQLRRTYLERRKTLKKIRKYHSTELSINGIRFPFSVLEKELELVLHNGLYFLNLIWLRNYFGMKTTETKVFYADEFYTTGRIISAAARLAANKKIKTYGVQHALLLENHTVYLITDKELNSSDSTKNGMPIPDHFIVWGDYFRQLFLKNNSLALDYIITAGNSKYIQLNRQPKSRNNGGQLKILWCTTLPEYFKAEYNMLESTIKELPAFTITFRLHPLGHIRQENINAWVAPDMLAKSGFSETANIFDDLAAHDLVICTIFSTTYFDALVMNKKTCRVITGFAKADLTGVKIHNLYDIRNAEDFKRAIAGRDDMQSDAINIDKLCFMQPDIWQKLLA